MGWNLQLETGPAVPGRWVYGRAHVDHGGAFLFAEPDWLFMGPTGRKIGRHGRLLRFKTRRAAMAYVAAQRGLQVAADCRAPTASRLIAVKEA